MLFVVAQVFFLLLCAKEAKYVCLLVIAFSVNAQKLSIHLFIQQWSQNPLIKVDTSQKLPNRTSLLYHPQFQQCLLFYGSNIPPHTNRANFNEHSCPLLLCHFPYSVLNILHLPRIQLPFLITVIKCFPVQVQHNWGQWVKGKKANLYLALAKLSTSSSTTRQHSVNPLVCVFFCAQHYPGILNTFFPVASSLVKWKLCGKLSIWKMAGKQVKNFSILWLDGTIYEFMSE